MMVMCVAFAGAQENRLTLYRACALLGGFGWLAMALATQVWMPFVIAGWC